MLIDFNKINNNRMTTSISSETQKNRGGEKVLNSFNFKIHQNFKNYIRLHPPSITPHFTPLKLKSLYVRPWVSTGWTDSGVL